MDDDHEEDEGDDESTSEATEEGNESDASSSSSSSSTEGMTTSDVDEWFNMPKSYCRQERRRQQGVSKLIKDPCADQSPKPMPQLASPKRKAGPSSPLTNA